ncbi:M1 family metallopeptidase [Silvimonas sp. JCM 19000]
MRAVLFPLVLTLAGLVPAAHAAAIATQLPLGVSPTHYDVSITPHARTLEFDAQTTASISISAPTRSITLNAQDLVFSRVTLSGPGGRQRAKVSLKQGTATFTFAHTLQPGAYRLAMTYRGQIGTQTSGLFAIDYVTPQGKQRALYTQFESADARRFIPCWDEPAYKASFSLDVTVPASQLAVSNMPIARSTPLAGGLSHITFAPTPRMSTYLLFFGLGDFERASAQVGPTEVGVIAARGKLDQARFALDAGQAVLREYNDYFGVPYPLPKLDNIAAPGDNPYFGAMENWGAIFTFESLLLVDPHLTTQAERQDVFDTAAHEIAHQWFGNLVTMRWWDDLWLNEGFASWMQARTTEKLHPEWHTAAARVHVRDEAIEEDALQATHPVVQPIATVEQTQQAFDTITYSKGQAVIDMLEDYVGAEAWRSGVQRYLQAHAYGNSASDDLWSAMQGVAADKPVARIARAFTTQPGVPLLKLVQQQCLNGQTEVQLQQAEYSADQPGKAALHWPVPVSVQVVGGAVVRGLVDGEQTLHLPGCGPVLINAGQHGYFRTEYTPDDMRALASVFGQLAAVDQLGLLHDAQGLAVADQASITAWLELVNATPANAEAAVWSDIATALLELDRYYASDTPARQALRRFAHARLSPLLAELGWHDSIDEAADRKRLRLTLIDVLGDLSDPDLLATARQRYSAPAAEQSADLRRAVLNVIAQNADAATWQQLRAQAQAETSALTREKLYSLLAQTHDPLLAQRALELALTPEPGATLSAALIRQVAKRHPDPAWRFAMAHLAQVDPLTDGGGSRYYPELAASSLDPAMPAQLDAYAQAHIDPAERRISDHQRQQINVRLRFLRTQLPQLEQWLAQH